MLSIPELQELARMQDCEIVTRFGLSDLLASVSRLRRENEKLRFEAIRLANLLLEKERKRWWRR